MKDTCEGKLYYATDKTASAQYIKLFEDRGIDVAILSSTLDMQFITMLENDKKIKCLRVDSSVDALREEGDAYENEALASLFKKASGKESLTVKFEALADEGVPALLTLSEESRRFADMMKLYGGMMPEAMNLPDETVLILNTKNNLIKSLEGAIDTPFAELYAKEIYTLAKMAQSALSADEMRDFLKTSYDVLDKALGNA